MMYNRNTRLLSRLSGPATRAKFVVEAQLARPSPTEQIPSQHPLPTWLPTMRTYMAWTFGISIVWEVVCLPLHRNWASDNVDQLTLFVIRAINYDLIASLGALIAVLFVFGSNRWPAHGYWRIAVLTIAFLCGFSALNQWLFVDAQDITVISGESLPDFGQREAMLSQIKWMVIPMIAFWKAGRCSREIRNRAAVSQRKSPGLNRT